MLNLEDWVFEIMALGGRTFLPSPAHLSAIPPSIPTPQSQPSPPPHGQRASRCNGARHTTPATRQMQGQTSRRRGLQKTPPSQCQRALHSPPAFLDTQKLSRTPPIPHVGDGPSRATGRASDPIPQLPRFESHARAQSFGARRTGRCGGHRSWARGRGPRVAGAAGA